MSDLIVPPGSIVTPASGRLGARRLRDRAARRRRVRRARHRRPRVLPRRALRHRLRALGARRVGRPRRPRVAVRRRARRGLPAARHALHGGAARGRSRCAGRRPASGAPARVLPASGVVAETRGHGAHERTIHPILMGDEAADALLVCEVLTPGRALVELPAAQARPRRAARGVAPRGDLPLPHRPAAGVRAPARLHGGREPGRDARARRRRHGARAARLPHGLGPARLRRLLPQRDGRPDARVGRGRRPGPRVDQGRVIDRPLATRAGTLRLRTLTPDDAPEFARHVAGDRAHLREHLSWGDTTHELDGARAWLDPLPRGPRRARARGGRVRRRHARRRRAAGGARARGGRRGGRAAGRRRPSWAAAWPARPARRSSATRAGVLAAERVVWRCTTVNPRSRALAERLGFRLRGDAAQRARAPRRAPRPRRPLARRPELDPFVAG